MLSRYGYLLDTDMVGQVVGEYNGRWFEYGSCVRTIRASGTKKPYETGHRREVLSAPPNFGLVIGTFCDFEDWELDYVEEEEMMSVVNVYYPRQDFVEKDGRTVVTL